MTSSKNTNDTKSVGAPTDEKDNTMAMLIMAGMVVSSAGFSMYTKQADSLLRRMNQASKIQGITNPPLRNVKINTKLVSKKPKQKFQGKTFHEKDDLF